MLCAVLVQHCPTAALQTSPAAQQVEDDPHRTALVHVQALLVQVSPLEHPPQAVSTPQLSFTVPHFPAQVVASLFRVQHWFCGLQTCVPLAQQTPPQVFPLAQVEQACVVASHVYPPVHPPQSTCAPHPASIIPHLPPVQRVPEVPGVQHAALKQTFGGMQSSLTVCFTSHESYQYTSPVAGSHFTDAWTFALHCPAAHSDAQVVQVPQVTAPPHPSGAVPQTFGPHAAGLSFGLQHAPALQTCNAVQSCLRSVVAPHESIQ